MTTININGTEHELKFGIKALAELDKMYSLPVEGGMSLPMGLQMAVSYLQAGNIPTVALMLRVGTGLSDATITKFMEADDTDIDVVFDTLIEALENGNLTKKFMRQLNEQMEQAK